MITFMSTESLIHGDYPDEPLTTAVARRLRGQLAEHRMTLEELGKVLGLSKMAASRRTNGETPISLAELELIEAATPITAAYLLTGQHPSGGPPPSSPTSHPLVGSQAAGAQIHRLRPAASGRRARDERTLVGVQDEVDDDAIAYLQLADDQPSDGLATAA